MTIYKKFHVKYASTMKYIKILQCASPQFVQFELLELIIQENRGTVCGDKMDMHGCKTQAA